MSKYHVSYAGGLTWSRYYEATTEISALHMAVSECGSLGKFLVVNVDSGRAAYWQYSSSAFLNNGPLVYNLTYLGTPGRDVRVRGNEWYDPEKTVPLEGKTVLAFTSDGDVVEVTYSHASNKFYHKACGEVCPDVLKWSFVPA